MATSYSSESGLETDLETDKKHDGELYINAIVPQKVPYDSKAQIVIVFNKSLPKNKSNYSVEFVGQNRAPMQVPATKLNECTLSVLAPVYYPPEYVDVRVSYGIQRKPLGSCGFMFESRAEILANLLFDSSDPVTFMCEALNISSQDLENLDASLSSVFMNNVPHGFDILGEYREKVERETYARYPTLLHFGAAFGLRSLVDSLLTCSCPGAAEAALLKNCYKMKPKDLAEHYGYYDIQEKLLIFEEKNEQRPYVDMESQTAYEIMGRETAGGYVSVDQPESELVYTDMTAGQQCDEDGSGYISADGRDQSSEAGYLVMSGREDVEDHYLDLSGNAGYDAGLIYEEMGQNNNPTEDPEEQAVYEPVESHGVDAPPVPPRGSSAIYDRPSNLPLSEYPFHRSASNSMNPREVITRKPVPKHKFTSGSGQHDDAPKDSVIVQMIMEKVRAGNLTQDEADNYLSRLGHGTQSTSNRDSPLIRSGSTSSRISNTSTASSLSTSSHGSIPERSGYGGDKEDNDDSMSLADLRKCLELRQRQGQEVAEKPPLLPPTDYDPEVRSQERPSEHPARRAPKGRNKTAPVNPSDVEKAQRKNLPSTLQRRGTAPPTNPKPGHPIIPKVQLASQDRRPSLPLQEPQHTDGRHHEKSMARPPQPPPANQRPAAPPPTVENRNSAAPTSPGPHKTSAPRPLSNIHGGMPTPFAVALKRPTTPQKKTETDDAPPRLSRPGQRPPLAPPRPQQRH